MNPRNLKYDENLVSLIKVNFSQTHQNFNHERSFFNVQIIFLKYFVIPNPLTS